MRIYLTAGSHSITAGTVKYVGATQKQNRRLRTTAELLNDNA
jgi:hypothetical protein